MLRRLLPTLVALGCGLLALGWGLFSLQRIFNQEREDARAQMRSRREALEHTATEALRRSLTLRLTEKVSAIHAAVEDPLAPAEGFYLVFRGYQFLPRHNPPSSEVKTPARETYDLLARHLEGGAPLERWSEVEGILARQLEEGVPPSWWTQRLERLRAAEAALAAGNARATSARVEDLLRYHASHPLSPVQELPFMLLAVERLERGPDTTPLVRALLREGLPEEFGGFARGAGLQRDLLRERSRFSEADFDFLHERIVRLSHALKEPTADFVDRANETDMGALVVPEEISEPILLGGGWYLEQRGEEAVYGLFVDVDTMLRPIVEDMRARRLFDADGRFRMVSDSPVQPLSTLRLSLDMPQSRAEADIEARYGLKTLLVAVCGALAVAIFVLAVVSQQRKYRFLELKSDFVATVSHELRTPLASIRLLGETLERKLSQAPEMRDYPARIVQAADGLHFLVENILSFNRIDKGRWKLRTSLVRLEELVNPLRDDLASATTVPVELTTDVGDAELEADPSLLRLLFSNLGRNACAYNRRTPVVISIRAQVIPGHFCTVLFQDNGVGIPAAEWENVFQDFYRLTQPGPEVHGSGLGLALCRKIMKLHGGDIQVVNSGPEGTTFALNFHEPHR
jgi:signal transduction histidine kinase